MLVAHILYPVEVLGPGKRIGIWVCGCHRRCEGCASPELQSFDSKRQISSQKLADMVWQICERSQVDGITISGGEPFEQSADLAEFLSMLPTQITDILIYTGYTLEELNQKADENIDKILKKTAVLVDGAYQQNQNGGHPLKGSENQQIHYLKPKYRQYYENYIDEIYGKNLSQNFRLRDGIFSVGIHKQQFRKQIEDFFKEKRYG